LLDKESALAEPPQRLLSALHRRGQGPGGARQLVQPKRIAIMISLLKKELLLVRIGGYRQVAMQAD